MLWEGMLQMFYVACADVIKLVISYDLSGTWDIHVHPFKAKFTLQMEYKIKSAFQLKQNHINCKKQLYISLVCSQLMFASVLWKLYLIRHIQLLEHIHRQATKYILNDYTSDYKTYLTKLKLLPLMCILDN